MSIIQDSVLNVTNSNQSDEFSATPIQKKIREIFKKKCERILLIQPLFFPEEQFDFRIAKNKRYYNYPPYGLGLLVANLKKSNYKIHILDLNMELLRFIQNLADDDKLIPKIRACWKKLITDCVKEFKPDIASITCMFTMCHPNTKDICKHLKNENPDLPILAGGVHVTNAPEIFLKEIPEVDFLSLYEGDISFCTFLDYINEKVTADNLFQISTQIDGNYHVINRRRLPTEGEMSMKPDYGNLNIKDYYNLGEVGNFRYWIPKKSVVAPVLSNRGCRAHCSFCSVAHFNGKGVRVRAIESVIDEITELKERYGVNHITWLDDDIFYDHKRTVNLYNEIVRKNLNITWDAMNGIIASAVAAHPETIHAAADSGCVAVNYGVESGNSEILKKVYKPSGIKHYYKVGEIMQKYPQIYSRAFIIIGFPNETFRQLLDTVNLCRDMKMDWYGIQLLSPLPSTDIFTQMVDQGLIEKDTIDTTIGSGFVVRQHDRQKIIEKEQQIVASDFQNYFKKNLDKIPTSKELNDMWLIMDYEANYKKILNEIHPSKLKKMNQLLFDVSFRMTKENPLSTLFLGIVLSKLGNRHEAKKYYALSKNFLNKSAFWQKRFDILEINNIVKQWENFT